MDSMAFHVYFAALYTFYSVANIFLPFFTGGLRDCNGDRLIFILLCLLMILGQCIFSYGVYLSIFLCVSKGVFLIYVYNAVWTNNIRLGSWDNASNLILVYFIIFQREIYGKPYFLSVRQPLFRQFNYVALLD